MDSRYKNPDNDPRGQWKAADFSVKTYSESSDYPITLPSGRVVNPPESRCWVTSKEKFEDLVKDKRIWFGKTGNNVPAVKKFLSEVKEGICNVINNLT
jgi:adenine-specific DNA-methyltransferase